MGDPLQTAIGSLFKSAGEPGKQVKNFLNGVWLGHPAHPAITDVPMGAWTCTAVFDAMSTLGNDRALERAADITLETGLLAALGSAVTGLTDWSDTYGRERKVGPLGAAAIAINVGTTKSEIRDALESLLQDARIVQTGDERFTSRSTLSRERLAHQKLPEAGRSGSR